MHYQAVRHSVLKSILSGHIQTHTLIEIEIIEILEIRWDMWELNRRSFPITLGRHRPGAHVRYRRSIVLRRTTLPTSGYFAQN